MSLEFINNKKIRKSFGKIAKITSLPNLPAFLDRNSVIPWYLFLNKCSFEIGQFIKPIIFLALASFIASLKHFKMYLLDFVEIFSKAFFWLYSILYIGRNEPFRSFILKLLSIFLKN